MFRRVKEWLERFTADEPTPEEIMEIRARETTFLDDLHEAKEGLRKFFRELDPQIYYVTDTSWWMEACKEALVVPEGAFLVIPRGVMRELDGLKRNPDKAEFARKATAKIEELIKKGKARIEAKNGGYWNVLASKTDEEVVDIAKKYEEQGYSVVLLSTDYAQRALALNEGIPGLKRISVPPDSYYSGENIQDLSAEENPYIYDAIYSALPGNIYHCSFDEDSD